ncbi:MAG TPA: hypothetical protein VHG88_14335 [Burkholderiales bacterium]|nr:hypothetical protein [Burkholderiales bacterium]
MSEPVTMLTDYALSAVSAYLGIRLFKFSKYWAAAFLALALAAFLGGTWHGFVQSDPLWKATILSVGVASFGMVAGSAEIALGGAGRRLLIGFAALKLLLYCGWMLFHDHFVWVIVDTASALAIVGALHLWRFNGWMLAGVGVSVLAAIAQAGGLALHRHFNHNDLYHVVQIAAMLLFYRGLSRG